MPSRSAGIPGIAVALAAAGGYLIFVGIKDVSFAEGLRQMLSGTTPTGKTPTKTPIPDELKLFGVGAAGSAVFSSGTGGSGGAAGTGTLGVRIADTARKYEGVPYRWGGSTPDGWDCSGFVSYVLNEVGLKVGRMTSAGFLTWSGATSIARSQVGAGDLLCWPGHVGIALDNINMINAPTFGIPTRIQKIWGSPTVRRVKG